MIPPTIPPTIRPTKTDPDTVLSAALRGIDAARRRAFATFAVWWLATFGALLWFIRVMRTSDDLERLLAAAVVVLVLAIFVAAFAVMLYVARMTRRILRAIEVAIVPPETPEG
jgi:uncharacterized membrane protein